MKLLVMGASGQQGGAVARALLQEGATIRVVGRDQKRLGQFKNHAETVEADFTDRASLKQALEGVDGAFLITTWFEQGVNTEIEHGKAFIEAAKEVKLSHLVFSSVGGADQNTGVPHFDSKYRIEQMLAESGLKTTILRPVWFMENFASPWFLPEIQNGQLKAPMDPDRTLQMVPVNTIGQFGAAALLRPHDYIDKTLQLATDALTFPEIAKAISSATGRNIAYSQVALDHTRQQLGEEIATMFSWFNRVGYTGDFNRLQKWNIPLPSFEDYLSTAEWVKELSLHHIGR